MDNPELLARIERAVNARGTWIDSRHESAFRLFNGFSEGHASLVIDVYARTLVIFASARESNVIDDVLAILTSAQKLDWIRAAILKNRNASTAAEKHGRVIWGEEPDTKIIEHGVKYAVDLLQNHDAGFYLDTRDLRKWLITHSAGKSVLNTFAYTGSLGVAAQAGGAARVTQIDRNRGNLQLANESYALNGYAASASRLIASDFFPAVAQLKGTKQLFDCVILDPPFFAATSMGRVQAHEEGGRLINKLRPLVRDGGALIAVNNALFVSGREYVETLEGLCADGYLQISEMIEVPQDVVGFEVEGAPITDPAPFNHATKIAVLTVRRK